MQRAIPRLVDKPPKGIDKAKPLVHRKLRG
jgi:hypothetical protein